MSESSQPFDTAHNAQLMDAMFKPFDEMMKPGTASASAFAAPAAFMAAPALGMGMMAQYWGAMFGVMHGACDMARRLPVMDAPLKAPLLFWSASDEDGEAFSASLHNPLSVMASATKTIYADMEMAARDIMETGEHVAADMANEAESVVVMLESARDKLTAPVAQGSSEELQPEDFVQPKAIDKPAAPDDLKLISGVGPKLEQTLNALGVWTFAQIAGWQAPQVAWVDDYLSFKGRIMRDGWIGQAAALAAGGGMKKAGKKPA